MFRLKVGLYNYMNFFGSVFFFFSSVALIKLLKKYHIKKMVSFSCPFYALQLVVKNLYYSM